MWRDWRLFKEDAEPNVTLETTNYFYMLSSQANREVHNLTMATGDLTARKGLKTHTESDMYVRPFSNKYLFLRLCRYKMSLT